MCIRDRSTYCLLTASPRSTGAPTLTSLRPFTSIPCVVGGSSANRQWSSTKRSGTASLPSCGSPKLCIFSPLRRSARPRSSWYQYPPADCDASPFVLWQRSGVCRTCQHSSREWCVSSVVHGIYTYSRNKSISFDTIVPSMHFIPTTESPSLCFRFTIVFRNLSYTYTRCLLYTSRCL